MIFFWSVPCIFAPAGLLPCSHLILGWVVLGVPDLGMVQFLGHVLLHDEMSREVVGVAVIFSVSQLLHQPGRGVAQVQGNGSVACLVHEGQRVVNGEVGAVALGAGGQVDGAFAQGDAPLGPPDLVDDVKCRVGQQQGVGVGQADVLGREDAQAAGDELRVLAAGN